MATITKLKPEAEVKELSKKKSNKNCFDCGRSGPQQNVNMTINTFVCTQCAGIHRKYNHKIKTINMSTFTPAEVEALETNGNKRARKTWLASFEEGKSYLLDPEDPANIDKFMHLCYVEKKWVKGTPAPYAGITSPASSEGGKEKKERKRAATAADAASAERDRAFTEGTFPASIPLISTGPPAASSATSPPAAAAASTVKPRAASTATADLGIDFLSNLTLSTTPAVPATRPEPAFEAFGKGSSDGALFDEAPITSPAGSTGSSSAEDAAVSALVDEFRRVQAKYSVAPSVVSQWVTRALHQFQTASAAGSPNPAVPLLQHQHQHQQQQATPSSAAALSSPPATAAEPVDAFADIALPGDNNAGGAGGADNGNPFDSSDDEDEPSSSRSFQHQSQSPLSQVLSPYQQQVLSPQQQQQQQQQQPTMQPQFPMMANPMGSPQQALSPQQFQLMQQQQFAQYQQQMMMQQQQQQQQQGAFGQPNAFGYPQAQAAMPAGVGPFGQPAVLSPQSLQTQQQSAMPLFQVPQTQPASAASQPAAAKPDLFADLGGGLGSF